MQIKLTSVFFFFRKKLLLNIMRATIFLLCLSVFSITPNNVLSQDAKIKIEKNVNVTVDEVFDLIMSQTDYTFIYQVDMFKDYPKVNVKKGTIKANKLLEKSLSIGDFNFVISGNNTIIIQQDSEFQELNISGKVTDVNGLPIAGITVYVTDRKPEGDRVSNNFVIRGTSTDFDGTFSLEAKEGYYLVAFGLGYEYVSQQVTTQTTYNITLKERIAELDEVVLIGYGSTTREEVSSAISSIKSEEINQNVIGNASFDRALSGLIKGVQIQQNIGRPGSSVDINIRGITSPFGSSDNNPLFVIDGVPFQVNPAFKNTITDETRFAETPNPLLGINPQDIESIDVLKDAAATSIYGSRGANGVIIVNTKKGEKGKKMRVNLSVSTTFGKPINTLDWLNADEFKEFSEAYIISSVEAANAGNIFPQSLQFGMADLDVVFDFSTFTFQTTYNGLNDSYFGDANTNWNDVVYRDAAATQKYNLSINGGSERSSYYLSLGYIDQEGLLLNDEFKQYNFRLGLDSQISKHIKMGANANLSYTDNFSGYSNSNGNLNQILDARPDFAPRNEEGEYNYPPSRFFGFFDQESPNPLAFTTENKADRKSYTALGNVYIESEVLKNLTVRGQVNGSFFFTDNNTYNPDFAGTFGITPFDPPRGPANSTLTLSKSIATSITTDVTTTYRNTFGNHSILGLLGFSWQRDKGDRNLFLFQGFPDDDISTTATNAEQNISASNFREEIGLNSIFSRVSYNYKNRYFLTANIRRDKSSRFGPNNKEAYFPSVAASWNIANEEFLKSSNLVNTLRLRASLGEVGSNNTGEFVYLQFFNRGARGNGLYNGQVASGLNDILPNPDIRWEVTKEFNIGLDFTLFNGRLRSSFDVYNKQTTDALIGPAFALESGATDYTENFADLSNKGIEFEISGDILRSKDFRWSAGFNISKNENELKKFNADGIDPFLIDRFEIGREIGLIRGHIVEGIFQDPAEVAASPTQTSGTGVGDYKYKDISGPNGTPDGIIDDNDREILGSTQADFFGGFNSAIQYKGFELSAFFNFSKGTESLVDFGISDPLNPQFGSNVQRRFSHPFRWSPTNTDATLPRLVSGDPNQNNRISTANVYDSSYLRLRNIQLKYNLNKKITDKLGLTNLSVYVSGSNLKTWTDFPGVDPEAGGGISASGGFDNGGAYPNAKSWSLGVNVNF
ncbi:SusC/RagA family TonB-linked outer membrane protein [Flavivirga rizhaonensis]|uniref:TonB-dependent receptor n=1 Tax=Flavivirga rizhaonensis TaxID=2559571 RepID=A0A4S1DRI7_9FLAO|nr:TonB-dependent receptor [Flavivirga rizhaonensis]TGV00560.1 TonB-dependent receptor [Flavivirga rizhaonensis]